MALGPKSKALDERDLYPASDGVPMEDVKHGENAHLLAECLRLWLDDAGVPVWAASNAFLYYRLGEPSRNVGPDFFAVLGARPDPDRDCWRVWNEDGLLPQVIVEFLSKTSGHKDRVTNFAIYRDDLGVRNYFICDNRKMRLEGYVLESGTYVRLLPDANGRLWCDAVGLLIGFHQGWLRWHTPEGIPLPTRAEMEARRADEASHQAEEARAEVERLRRLLEEGGG